MDAQIIVDMLNELLAEDPDAVKELLGTRPYVTMSAKEVVSIDGPRLSLLGIINEILRRHGSFDYIVSAECEFDNEDIKNVKYFQLMKLLNSEED